MKLKLKDIRLDGDTQPREFINQDLVNEYAEAMLEDSVFPPAVVFNDGANYWLASGFHRYFANKKAGFLDIECEVKTGTLRDARLFSVGTNSTHGLRRTNGDKRKSVMILLNDIEWSEWSDSEIARQCDVSHVFVGRVRKSMGLENTERKYVDQRSGKETKMKTPEVTTLKPAEAAVADDRLQEMAVANVELADEIDKLKDTIAVGFMEGTEEEKRATAYIIEDLRAQVKMLEAELNSVKKSRDDYQNKCSELIKQVNYWKKQANQAAA